MVTKLHLQACNVRSKLIKKLVLTSCVTIACFIYLSAQSSILSLSTSVPKKVTTVKSCIESIYNQHDIVVTYSSSFVNENQEVSLASNKPAIRDILGAIIEGHPLNYQIKNKYKIILVQDEEKLEELAAIQREKERILVSGYVQDETSGEPLIGSYVYNPSFTQSTITDVNGYFQLEVRPNEEFLNVSFVGYGENKVSVKDLYSKRVENILLAPNLELEEIVIEATLERKLESIKTQNYFINFQDLNDGVSSFGEHDPYRSLKQLPSIQSGREADNNIFVRGGGPDQNLILMDGVPMYETSHILGLSSIFNVDAIKNIQVYKDAFPAKFGGRLSSIIDFQMKEGNVYEHKRNFNFSPSSIRAQFDGPIQKGVSSYNFSARSSFLDLFYSDRLKEVLDFTDTEISFLDINFKLTHQFNDGSKLKVNSYFGKDIVLLKKEEDLGQAANPFEFSNSEKITWGNSIAGVHYIKPFSDKLNSKFSFNASTYRADSRSSFGFETEETTTDTIKDGLDVITQSNVNDIAFKSDFDYFVNNDIQVNFGAGYALHSLSPRIRQSKFIDDEQVDEILDKTTFETIKANEYYTYVNGSFSLPSQLTLNVGGRFNVYSVRDVNYPSIQPRFSLSKNIGENHHMVFSANRMVQFVHLLVNNGIGLPSRLWLPSTDILPPEYADQLSLSYQYNFSDRITVELGGYLKQMFNVVEYSKDADLFSSYVNNDNLLSGLESESENWEEFVDSGKSDSRGLEFSLLHRGPKLDLNVAYSLSKTNRTFDDINDGEPFPFRYDRRHDLTMYVKYNITPSFNVFSTWIFGSGDAFTLSTVERQGPDGSYVSEPPGRNNIRSAYYKRFDIGLQYMKDLPGPGQKMRIDFAVQNVFNRENVYYYYVLLNPVTDRYETKEVSVFPLLPQFNIYLTL